MSFNRDNKLTSKSQQRQADCEFCIFIHKKYPLNQQHVLHVTHLYIHKNFNGFNSAGKDVNKV